MEAVSYENSVSELITAMPEFYEIYKYDGVGINDWEPPYRHSIFLWFATYTRGNLKLHDLDIVQRCLDFMERLAMNDDRNAQDLVGEFLFEFQYEELKMIETMANPNLLDAIMRQYKHWDL